MDAELEEIIIKIQKLLKLAESDNEGESFNATVKAQQLLQKYNLDRSRVVGYRKESEDVVLSRIDYAASKLDLKGWEARLSSSIAYAFMCASIVDLHEIILIGSDANTRVARDVFIRVRISLISLSYKRMHEYTKATKEVMREVFGVDNPDMRRVKGHYRPYEFRKSWLEGTISGIDEKIRNQHNSFMSSTTGYSIILDNDLKLRSIISRKFPGVVRFTATNIHSNDVGHSWGHNDGLNTSLHRGDIGNSGQMLISSEGEQ